MSPQNKGSNRREEPPEKGDAAAIKEQKTGVRNAPQHPENRREDDFSLMPVSQRHTLRKKRLPLLYTAHHHSLDFIILCCTADKRGHPGKKLP